MKKMCIQKMWKKQGKAATFIYLFICVFTEDFVESTEKEYIFLTGTQVSVTNLPTRKQLLVDVQSELPEKEVVFHDTLKGTMICRAELTVGEGIPASC